MIAWAILPIDSALSAFAEAGEATRHAVVIAVAMSNGAGDAAGNNTAAIRMGRRLATWLQDQWQKPSLTLPDEGDWQRTQQSEKERPSPSVNVINNVPIHS